MSEITTPRNSLQRAAFAMVLLNCFTTPLMLSAANVALPAIARDLRINAVLLDRKSTRLNSSHMSESRMPSSA